MWQGGGTRIGQLYQDRGGGLERDSWPHTRRVSSPLATAMPPPFLPLTMTAVVVGGVGAQLSGRPYYRGQHVALTCQGKGGDWNALIMCHRPSARAAEE